MNTKKPIPWTDYFDKIYCIHYLPHEEKLAPLEKELKRVGIKDSGILDMRYTSPSPYDDHLFKIFKDNIYCPRKGYVNICLEIRKILYESKHYHYRHILLLEDDVVFLKSRAEIRRILEASPDDFDIVQYDKFVLDNGWMKQEWNRRLNDNKVNGWFLDATGTVFTSAACLGLSYRGVSSMLRVMDERICGTDVAPLLMTDCKYACAIKNMAIQRFDSHAYSLEVVTLDFLHRAYANGGVKYSDYNLPRKYIQSKTI